MEKRPGPSSPSLFEISVKKTRKRLKNLNIAKARPNKPRTNIRTLNEDKAPTLLSVLSAALEALTRAVNQEKEQKEIQKGEEEVKDSLIAGNLIRYFKDPHASTSKSLTSH